MLSSEIRIVTTDSHSIIDSDGKRINPDADVLIGNHVWIGQQVIINKGVKISDDVIIGARSIVTRDIESNTCVAGTPAKVIKKNINWLRKRI